MLRTTDNNINNPLIISDERDLERLSRIANKSISGIADDNPSLLVFPPDEWKLGVKKNEDKVFELSPDGKLVTGNIMGFIGCDGTELAIASRFETTSGDYFLHYMLQKALQINVVDMPPSRGDDYMLDFLPYLFPAFLKQALAQGLYRKYTHKRYNDANIKGTIDVMRHVRLNIPFLGKIAYNTREYSYDNDMTQLVRHTIEYLRTGTVGNAVLNADAEIRAMAMQVESATPSYNRNERPKVIRANLRAVNHPFFTAYKPLQALCLQILRQEKTSLGGEKDRIYGLLFRGDWLWEEYIAKALSHRNIQHKTHASLLFECGHGIIPDFIIEKGEHGALFIGDAKYKRVNERSNLSAREDYFQILAYMYRYSCETGHIFFPFKDSNDADLQLAEDCTKKYELTEYIANRIRVVRNETRSKVVEIGLRIPQNCSSFSEFAETMSAIEKECLDKIEMARPVKPLEHATIFQKI